VCDGGQAAAALAERDLPSNSALFVFSVCIGSQSASGRRGTPYSHTRPRGSSLQVRVLACSAQTAQQSPLRCGSAVHQDKHRGSALVPSAWAAELLLWLCVHHGTEETG